LGQDGFDGHGEPVPAGAVVLIVEQAEPVLCRGGGRHDLTRLVDNDDPGSVLTAVRGGPEQKSGPDARPEGTGNLGHQRDGARREVVLARSAQQAHRTPALASLGQDGPQLGAQPIGKVELAVAAAPRRLPAGGLEERARDYPLPEQVLELVEVLLSIFVVEVGGRGVGRQVLGEPTGGKQRDRVERLPAVSPEPDGGPQQLGRRLEQRRGIEPGASHLDHG